MNRLKTRPVRGDAEIRRFFDEVSCDYRDQHGSPEALLAYRLSLIRSLLGAGDHGTLLEIGCGTGIHLFALADRFERLIGTDLSPGMIANARGVLQSRQDPEKFTLAVDPAERLDSVPANTVDAVLCVGALEHMPEKSRVLEQVRRVLKPGGCWVCLTLNGDFVWYRHWAPLLGIETRHLSSDRLVNQQEISDALQVVGLERAATGYWSFVPSGDLGPVWGSVVKFLDRIGRILDWSALRGGLYFKALKPRD